MCIDGAYAVTCTSVTGGGDAIISADCDRLVLDSAGVVTINSGTTISGDLAIRNATNSSTTSLIINGSVSSGNNQSSIYLQSGSQVSELLNSGTISSGNSLGGQAIGIGIEFQLRTTSIAKFVNSGTITVGMAATGISNSGGVFSSFINSGIISTGNAGLGSAYAINNNNGLISNLTNTGTLSTGTGGTGIRNNTGVITTLNNLQGYGNAVGGLTYSGNLPTNYNIIVRSANYYGQLAVTSPSGATTFGIYGGGVDGVAASTLAKGTYSSVLSGITSANLTGATSGNYNGFTWRLNNSSGTIWDLIINGASTADTQQSLANTASQLQNTYTLQNTVLANSFSYDCNTFGENNVCVSAGGRNTQVSAANGLNNTSALLIAAYRPHPNYRIGAYADQNLSVNNAGATVNLGNNTPLLGLFGVWNERLDDTGTQVKVSAAYGQKNTTVNRQVVGLSEAGSGSSQLSSQGAQVAAQYGFGIAQNVIVSPYAGIRYTQNNMGGYTEGASSSVTAPLTYSALNTNATTVLAGIGGQYKGIPKTNLFASAGVESDANTQNGSINATGISGLTSVNFNPNPVKTRPTAMLGVSYDIEKNQRLGITGIYRQEAYQAVGTTTVMATYTVGL